MSVQFIPDITRPSGSFNIRISRIGEVTDSKFYKYAIVYFRGI